ncbi:MAG: NMD3-related protein [Pyrobaculum sp.]
MAKTPCPLCGRLVDKLIEGMCRDCYIERHPLIRFEGRPLRCKYCGAVFLKGRWVKARKAEDLTKRILSEVGEVRGEIVRLEAADRLEEMYVSVTVRGSPHPSIEPTTLEYKMTLRFELDICNSCLEALSKRERALVQIRTVPRPLDSALKQKILHIIEQELSKLREKRIGYISDLREVRNGIDIYTTSTNLARHIAYVLREEFPAHVTESAKVMGVRDGRKIYHMTYLVRILTYKPGDVVKIRGNEKVVVEVGKKTVYLHDVALGTYEQFTISEILRSNVKSVI